MSIKHKKELSKFCHYCHKPIRGEKIWCEFTDEAIKIGYKRCGNKECGQIIGESRDGEEWRVVWDGITTPPSNYFKEYIKIINISKNTLRL